MASQQAQKQVADENTTTIYGMTVGELVDRGRQDLESLRKQLQDATDRIAEQSAELSKVRAELTTVKAKPAFTDEQVRKAIGEMGRDRKLQKLPDGSARINVIIPPEAVMMYESEAEQCSDPVDVVVQRSVETAILAYCGV